MRERVIPDVRFLLRERCNDSYVALDVHPGADYILAFETCEESPVSSLFGKLRGLAAAALRWPLAI